MMKTPTVSIIIPTYKGGRLLKYVLEALTNQTSQDFEVLTIVKPSKDATEEIIKTYSKKLKMKVIKQTKGYVIDAYNLGLKNTQGKIIIILDDDAIPFPDLVAAYIMAYKTPGIGGVAGDVIPVSVSETESKKLKTLNRKF